MTTRQKQILDLLYDQPVLIGHWVGFKDLTALHNEWLRSFLYFQSSQTKQAHRGSYKTTDVSLFMALHILVAPYKNVLFFRKTDTDVIEVIKQVKQILTTGCVREIVHELYGIELEIVKDNASEIDTNLVTGVRGASQIVGMGTTGSVTGKHADIIVTDDIVNLKDRISRAERERIKIFYQELQNVCNRGGRFINLGTPWHKDDAFTLMPNIEKYDCYSTGLITPEKLKELRSSMSPSLFAANYELKHIADADAMFTEPQFTDQVELLYNGISHIDAAYGGEDYTAYTAFKRQPDGTVIGFGKIWQNHVDDCLNEIAAYQEKYRLGTIHCERNADKGYLAKELRSNGLPCDSYAEKMNKFIKISTYLKANWSRIYWINDTDPEYLAQILDYTEQAAHDDAPDSAACLIRVLSKPAGGINLFKEGI